MRVVGGAKKHEKALPALADRALRVTALARRRTGRAARLLGLQLIDVGGQTRFVSCRSVAVQDTLLNRLVDDRDCSRQGLQRILGSALGDQLTQLPDLRTETGAVGAVDLVALYVLAIALLC